MMISRVASTPFTSSASRQIEQRVGGYGMNQMILGTAYSPEQYGDNIRNLDPSKINSSSKLATKAKEISSMVDGIETLKGKIRVGEGRAIAENIRKIEELKGQGQAKIISRVVGLAGLRAKLETGDNEGAISGLGDLQAALRAKQDQITLRFVHTLIERSLLKVDTPTVNKAGETEGTVDVIETLKDKIRAGEAGKIIENFKEIKKIDKDIEDRAELISVITGLDKLAARLEAGNNKDALNGLSDLQAILRDKKPIISRRSINIEA